MGLLSDQIAALYRCAQQHYAAARACDDAATKRRLVAMADDYVRQAKDMQRKQEQIERVRAPGRPYTQGRK
jgi:hypothetical protein